jgi:hypothetical protein
MFDTIQKLSEFLLEIMTPVPPANIMGSDKDFSQWKVLELTLGKPYVLNL